MTIHDEAFRNCTGLLSITIPSSVTNIKQSAFQGCSSLQSITLPFVGDGITNTHFGYIFGALSYSNNNTCVPASLKTVTITGGSGILDNAFQGCTGLTDISIPASVTSIGNDAFSGCNNLTSVTFEGSGTNISTSNAFPEGSTNGNALRTAYTNLTTGGAGTYTRAANGDTWTKTP